MKVYQLKITLQGVRPSIWRRIQVPSGHTLNDLHLMIQASMGWMNCHLHSFHIGEFDYTDCFADDQRPDELDDHEYTLKQVLGKDVKKIEYTYDFGDDWHHQIVVEAIENADSKVKYPVCLSGQRACPLEDCGSVPGYYNCLEALENPTNPENKDLIEWIGEYDPEEFNLEETNETLRSWQKMVVQDF